MLISDTKILFLLVTFSVLGYVQSRSPLRCGVHQNLQECPLKQDNCTKRCICKPGFVEVKGKNYCEPKPVRCAFKLVVDLVFIIDGSEYVTENMFNDFKSFLVNIIKNVYSSGNDVRVGIVIYGPKDPTVIFLDKTENLCDVLKIITDIHYIPNGKGTSLIDAFRITGDIVLSQCHGARIGSIRQIFVIGRLSEVRENEKDKLFNIIGFYHKQGHRVTLVVIDNEVPIPQTIYHLSVKTTKDLSHHLAQIFEVTCRGDICPKGYQKVGYHCIDINECDSSACHKNSKCINTPGSFVCYCSGDLQYISLEKGCGPKPDPCPSETKVITVCDAVTCKAPGTCTNSNGMNFCICRRGFTYDVKKGCIDFDECTKNPCLRNGECKNTIGSFECLCKNGFQYNVDFGCIDIDECLNPKSCSGNGMCVNTVGSYNCTCNSGYQYIPNKGCIDIDECIVFPDTCGENVTCVNTPGSFKCVCGPGFDYKEKKCVDIDECLNATTCPLSSTCTNLIGSYSCTCNKGFIFVEQTKTCELDKSMDLVQPKADLLFVVDASENMKSYLDVVKEAVDNLIKDYKIRSIALIKQYFALTTGGNSEVKIIFTQLNDTTVVNRTNDITYMGGTSVFSAGLKASRELYIKDGQTNSSKLVISITATKPSTFSSNEIIAIQKEVKEIKRGAQLIIIYIGEDVKSSEWNVVFKDKEVDEYVIAVTRVFISTIYKIIYEKTDRLIKCPDGFIFLDTVCQYKTVSAKYCDWNGKQYALNSTWTNACAIYNCTESGVVLFQRSCMGFDGDCYKDNDFFPCNAKGQLNWRCRCMISPVVDVHTNKVTQVMDYLIIGFDQNASIASIKLVDDTGKCTLPFKYENKWFYACTDDKSPQRWCSHTTFYQKIYSYCAKQVTTQCIFEKKTYNEGDQWKVGCNNIVCRNGLPSITTQCPAQDGTCVPLDTLGYPCQIGNDKFKSCICVADNYGYGKNSNITGKITDEGTDTGGSLVEYCKDKLTGAKYKVGTTWDKSCFSLRCTKGGSTEIISRQCESIDKKCYKPGNDDSFSCSINGVTKTTCKCVLENDELVLISYEGEASVKEVITKEKFLAIFKLSK